MADVVAEPTNLIREEDAAERLSELLARARVEVSKAVVGHDTAVDLMLISALARGHILLEGPPGTAKTLLAQAMARVLGANFQRVQFTPDTTPNELIGTMEMRGGELVLERGAIFGREGRFRAADREHTHGAAATHERDEAPPVIRPTLAARAWVQPPRPPRSERLLDVSGDRRRGRGRDHLRIQFAIRRHDGQHVVVREQDHGGTRCPDRLSRGRQQGLDHLGLGHALRDGSRESLETRQALQNSPQLRAFRSPKPRSMRSAFSPIVPRAGSTPSWVAAS